MAARKYPWSRIRVAFLQGKSPQEISAEFNVPAIRVSNHATRKKWVKERTATKEKAAEQCVERILGPAEEFVQLVASRITGKVSQAFDRPFPENSKLFQAEAGGLHKLVQIGRDTFGLNRQEEGPKMVVNVQVLHEVGESIDQQTIQLQPVTPTVIPNPSVPAEPPDKPQQ